MQTNLVTNTMLQLQQRNNYPLQSAVYTPPIKDEVPTDEVILSDKDIEKAGDTIVEPTMRKKAEIIIEQTGELPDYVKRGLKGDPDYNFYEFLQTGKIPYYLGGAGLVAVVNAGANAINHTAKIGAKANAKTMAAGAAMYYLMASLATTAVELPVKLARGFDLNQPVKTVIETRPDKPSGEPHKKREYHNAFESAEFTRWYLFYNEGKNAEVNNKFDAIAKKMGVENNPNDSDNIVKPTIQSMIKQSRAWKGIIGALAVVVGVGIGQQDVIKKEFGTGLFSDVKSALTNSNNNILGKSKAVLTAINSATIKPLAKAVSGLWKGVDGTFVSKHTGKTFMLGLVGSVILANIRLLSTSNHSNAKVVNVKEANN